METYKAITTRRSVRRFLDKDVPDGIIRRILTAGMSGPSAVNARPWAFLVVKDKHTLQKMADANGSAAEPLRRANFAILVCGDSGRFFERAPDFWNIDASIAAQNMILAAHDMGVGSVWLGTYPVEEKSRAQAELFGLPEGVIPHSIVAFGYPEEGEFPERDLYEEDRVHFEKW